MNRQVVARLCWIVVAGIGLAVRCAGASELPRGWLCGVALDPDGRAVAGATVFLDDYDFDAGDYRPIAKTTSGADGSFRLGPLAPQFRVRHDLRILAAGFAPMSVPGHSFSIFSGAQTNLGQIQLDRGQVLGGQVLDFDGNPVPGAAVECAPRRYVADSFVDPLTPIYRLSTDQDGRFTTPLLPVSIAGITVRVPGRLMPWVRVSVGPSGRVELPPIRLEKSEPIRGKVVDEQGRGIAGASYSAFGWEFGPTWLTRQRGVTDADGNFVFDGLGRRIQFQISAENCVGINRILRGAPDGVFWADVQGWDGDARRLKGPVNQLDITLHAVAWIEGRVIDADTGKPVHLERIVRCNFDRKPNGEIVLNGCQSPQFEQNEDGTFRVQYSFPDEYHLTLSAPGYRDGEAITPKVSRIEPVKGILVKMHRLPSGAEPQIAHQTIFGTVTRDGCSVKTGWVVLSSVPGREADIPNVAVCRGRTVPTWNGGRASAAIQDGRYSLDVPYQGDDWVVEVEEPGRPIVQTSRIAVGLNEHKKLDIALVPSGSITGCVGGIPIEWKNDTWVVAFAHTGVRYEAPVGADGSFSFHELPPGEYGLKAGHDAYLDAERPSRILTDNDPAYGTPAQPWKRATIVRVEPGGVLTGVKLELPDVSLQRERAQLIELP